MIEANPNYVICPGCCHQFRAIPVNVQDELAALRAENERLKQSVLDELPVLEKLNSRFGEVCIERDTLRAENADLKKEASLLSHLAAQHLSEARMAQAENKHLNDALTNANKFMRQFATDRDAAQADAARMREALEGVMYWDNGKPEWAVARAALGNPDAKT